MLQKYIEENIAFLRESESFRKELVDVPKLALLAFDSLPDFSGHSSRKRRRISSSPLLSAELGLDVEGAASLLASAAAEGGIDVALGNDLDNAPVGGNVVL